MEHANYVEVKDGRAVAYYSEGGAAEVFERLAAGPGSLATDQAIPILQDLVGGCLLVDHDRRHVIASAETTPWVGGRQTLLEVAERWPGWTLEWSDYGTERLVDYDHHRRLGAVAHELGVLSGRFRPMAEVVVLRPDDERAPERVDDGLFLALVVSGSADWLERSSSWRGCTGWQGVWPRPGTWQRAEAATPRSGIRLLRPRDLWRWLTVIPTPQDMALWLVEARSLAPAWHGVFASEARLVRRLDWDRATDRRWACDAFEHVAPITHDWRSDPWVRESVAARLDRLRATATRDWDSGQDDPDTRALSDRVEHGQTDPALGALFTHPAHMRKTAVQLAARVGTGRVEPHGWPARIRQGEREILWQTERLLTEHLGVDVIPPPPQRPIDVVREYERRF